VPEYQLDLDEPVAGAHLAELGRRVYFLSEAITDFRLVGSGDTVTAVVATTDRPVSPDDLTRKLRFVVDHEVRAQLPTPPKVLWRSPSGRRPGTDVFDRLVADGLAHEIGPGQVALGGAAITALDALDSLLRRIIVGEFGAREYRYPTLLPVNALHRSGYLSSFPQHLMFAARLDGDLDNYRAFTREAAERSTIGEQVLGRCGPVDRCLPPTMCYHTFDQFASSIVDGTLVVTAKGGSFRHESRYHRTLERLSDFTIRETVFVGPARFVREARDRLRRRAIELVEELDLAGRCEVANDPFFAGAEGAAKVSSQRLLELKHELHLDIGGDDADSGEARSIAVGSFNLHERHFTEAFDIRGADGTHAFSSCVGFGLERLTYAVLCQYGWDVRDWPPALRAHAAVAIPEGQRMEGQG
jgi:seryl-tRNA synthetase